MRLQQAQGGRHENAISERAQPDNGYSVTWTEPFENAGSHQPLLVDGGLVNQHDGDLVADGIDAVTGDATQAASIRLQFDFGPAGGTDEDFEEFSADRHVKENCSEVAPAYAGAASGKALAG
jgi:hypothetical protein